MIDVLHITDVHLMRQPGSRLLNVDTQRSLVAVLDQALADGTPDVVLATGDLAHEPDVEVYVRFLATIRARFAGLLVCTPGNHDLIDPMREAGLPMDDRVVGDWQFVALDSHGDDSLPATVDRRRVVDMQSRFCGRHVLIATHHHLLPIDCPWLDNDRIVEPALHDLLSHSDTVRAVAFGHVHQLVDRELGRTRLLGTPSTCFQFAPRTAKFSIDDLAPGYRRIHLHDDGTVATTVHRTPPLAEPARIGSRTEQ